MKGSYSTVWQGAEEEEEEAEGKKKKKEGKKKKKSPKVTTPEAPASPVAHSPLDFSAID